MSVGFAPTLLPALHGLSIALQEREGAAACEEEGSVLAVSVLGPTGLSEHSPFEFQTSPK